MTERRNFLRAYCVRWRKDLKDPEGQLLILLTVLLLPDYLVACSGPSFAPARLFYFLFVALVWLFIFFTVA